MRRHHSISAPIASILNFRRATVDTRTRLPGAGDNSSRSPLFSTRQHSHASHRIASPEDRTWSAFHLRSHYSLAKSLLFSLHYISLHYNSLESTAGDTLYSTELFCMYTCCTVHSVCLSQTFTQKKRASLDAHESNQIPSGPINRDSSFRHVAWPFVHSLCRKPNSYRSQLSSNLIKIHSETNYN